MGRLGAASLVTAVLVVAASAAAGWLWGRRFATAADSSAAPVAAASSTQAKTMSALVGSSAIAGWLLGWLLGWLTQAPGAAALTGAMSGLCLNGLLLVIGYDLGKVRIWRRILEYGAVSLTLPLSVGLASLAGAAVAAALVRVPLGRALCAGSGFGWYSMAGAVALEEAGAEIGAYVFLSNLLRELITILAAPFLSGRVPPVVGAAMGGATSMDSTLPAITRSFGPMGAVWGLITGTGLSLVSPFLLNLFLRLPL